MRKPSFEIPNETLFLSGEILKRERALSIGWLLEVGQTSFEGMSKEEKSDYFFGATQKNINRYKEHKIIIAGKERTLNLCAVPAVLTRKYHYPLFKMEFYNDAISKVPPEERWRFPPPYKADNYPEIINEIDEFLLGLRNFVTALRNSYLIEGKIEIGPINAPSERFLICDDDERFRHSSDFGQMKNLGPLLLSDLLVDLPRGSLKICVEPSCKKLFFSTHSTQKCCSLKCTNKCSEVEKRKIFEKTEKIPDYDRYRQLISRKSYMKNRKVMSDSEIKSEWRKENFENVEHWIKRIIKQPKRKKKSSNK